MNRAALALALCMLTSSAVAAKYQVDGGWTVNAEVRGSKISGSVSGRYCKLLQLDIFTSRWGHAVVQVQNVAQSRRFFTTSAAVIGRGPAPAVSSIYATCQD